MKRRLYTNGLIFLFAVCAMTPIAHAATLFWTNISGNTINKTATPGPVTTTIFSGATSPDSLIFDLTGSNILYTDLFSGGVHEVGVNGLGDTQLASNAQLGGSTFVQDLALEPGGGSVLVSTTDIGNLYRINLTTHAVTLVANLGSGLRGITYDGSGHLFAVITNTGTVEHINPTTGAVITSKTVLGGIIDGITFDSVTGNLFVANAGSVSILPTSLATVSTLICSVCNFIDGIESDGAGLIYLADSSAGAIRQCTTAIASCATFATTPGLDDIAPVSGLGAPPGVPEPSSVLLLSTGLGLALLWKFRRRFV
jgi:DNA-binding beta-propeller fold protein YncE